jgi:inorganic triphosphatase YgiF
MHDAAMDKEIELKLQVAPENIPVLRNHPHFANTFHDSTQQTLNSIYFDSPDQFLREHGLTLRVRQIGSKHVQTIKSVNQGSDWLERSEWEQTIEGDQPDLTHVTNAALGRILTDEVRNALKPIFQTRIERTTCHVNGNATDVVVAIDEGQVVAKDSSCGVAEIELELKRGTTSRLFEIARAINDIVPAQLYVKSKSERGYDLIENRPATVEKAYNPAISTGIQAGHAFTMIGRACLRHLVANTTATINRDVEALHQMRVALRRLRASISLFSDFLDDDKINMIKTELRWLAREFGPARNVDTLIMEVIQPLRKQHRKEPGLVSIGRMFGRQRLQSYRRVQEAVQSARFRKLVLDTAEWVEAGPWSTLPLTRARRETPIEIYAAEQLLHRFKKVRRKGAKIAELNPDQLHRLRIQVKKARYAVEFFFNLYSGKKSGKRRKKVLSSLAQLQAALGRINDIVTHKGLFTDIIANPRRGLTAKQNHQRAYAAGLIIGDQQAQIQGLLDRARKAHSRFDNVEPFWILPSQYSGFSQGA